jgi:hypothetical protein
MPKLSGHTGFRQVTAANKWSTKQSLLPISFVRFHFSARIDFALLFKFRHPVIIQLFSSSCVFCAQAQWKAKSERRHHNHSFMLTGRGYRPTPILFIFHGETNGHSLFSSQKNDFESNIHCLLRVIQIPAFPRIFFVVLFWMKERKIEIWFGEQKATRFEERLAYYWISYLCKTIFIKGKIYW